MRILTQEEFDQVVTELLTQEREEYRKNSGELAKLVYGNSRTKYGQIKILPTVEESNAKMKYLATQLHIMFWAGYRAAQLEASSTASADATKPD